MPFTKKTWVNVPDASNLPSIPEGQDSLARFDAENMNRIEGGVEEVLALIGEHTHSKEYVGLGNVDNTSDINKPVSTAQATAIEDAKNEVQNNLNLHTADTTNPHNVTALQVGLGNVPDVATNDQTPTYVEASTLEALTSGEKLSIAFGKIKKAITDLISHIANTTNHITAAERTAWNGKAPTSHANTATTYGVGTESNFGHLKITDSTSSTAASTAASAKAIKSVADALSSLQTSVTSLQNSGSTKIVSGSYVGTGTYVMAKSSDSVMTQKANKIVLPGFPLYVAVKRSGEDFPTVMMPNPETREADFKSYAGNDYSGGLCSCYVKSDNSLIWYTSSNKWNYKANTSTGAVTIEIPTMTDTEKANLGAIHQLNWEGETYDYIAICDSPIT